MGSLNILCLLLLACLLLLTSTKVEICRAQLIFLSNPGDAVCLDGSPPAYSFDRGTVNNWIVHLQGGGWCSSLEDCTTRSTTYLGSSKYMTAYGFSGLISNSPSDNPDFYNWNRVFVRYCDGGAFAGNVEEPISFNGQTLYFRGQKIWEAVINELLGKGLATAGKAILSGDSAGGSSTIFHCNELQEKLPKTDVRCLSDGGYFVDIPDLAGAYSFQKFYQDVVTLHNINVPSACATKYSAAQCYFPSYSLAYVKVPIFILQSPIDPFQVRYILAPSSSYSNGGWDSCRQDISTCSTSQLDVIQDQLRGKMLGSLRPLVGSKGVGMYIISCYYHTIALDNRLWNQGSTIDGMTPAKAFHQWYFGDLMQEIDCLYPCNPTCINIHA